jgi:hypothetical protein
VKSFTTACASSTKFHTSQSKKKPSTETGNTCILYPDENKASLSDASDGSKEDYDKKMMLEDELNNANFDLSLFWKIKSSANLDGIDVVESNSRFEALEEEITRQPDGRYPTPIPWTEQINGDWKEILSWPQGDWKAR